MRRKRQFNAGVRLSDKERIIVRYIVSQLETAYRNSAGKPVYARNMDQVMNDIFGVKKFTKTLERGRYNEAIMIGLMRQLDAATMWQICRSKEHYKLLCTLVALDAYIVDKRKKFDKMLQLEPTDRPTKKMRKLKSQAKKAAKLYKACIKTFRDVFDIKKVSSGGGEMFDILNDWLDDHTGGDDIFFDMDRGFSVDDVESMDEYIRGRRGGGRRSNGSALGLDFDSGDEDDLLDDGDDIGNASLEDLLMELNSRGVDIRPLVNAYQKKGPRQHQMAHQPDVVFDDFDDDEPADNGDNSYMAQLIRTMAEGFDSLRNDIAAMGGGRPRPSTSSTYAGSPLERMMDASNPSDDEDEGPLDPEPIFTDNPAEELDPNRPVPGGEVEPEA